MKKTVSALLTIIGAFTISSCSQDETALGAYRELRNPDGLSHAYDWKETLNEAYRAFKEKLNQFSSGFSEALIQEEYEAGTNFACSPLSVILCTGLAIRCADGQTRSELLNALGVDFETFDRYYKLYFNELSFESYDGENRLAGQMSPTNSIWLNQGIELKEDGLDALRDDYYCHAYEADFLSRNKEANQKVTDFLSEKTNGLLQPDLNLSTDTLFVLMNILYLKDVWNQLGLDLEYADEGFHFQNADGTLSGKRLLQGEYFDGKALEEEGYSAFKTFTMNGFELTFLTPSEGKTAKEVFTEENISYVLGGRYVSVDKDKKEIYHTRCIFPEFEAECDVKLSGLFKERYGVNALFDERCDFSNITDSDVYCEEFAHIAKLKVDKKGIEGAAVTYLPMVGSPMPDESYKEVYLDFPVDKEFGFVLRRKGVTLFSGIVDHID